ncbi:unnamed protein product [Didymodactylos carnosus]|uniref:Uncharacterized protein n=1 Tax=Didymodactylos carnosus TaxID=1234261 RepID=A0A8S2FBR5_9BILA|nr:unnamed protein product [Didymodactylos carnosus]CAF4216921.1 unnamed protein product [Didymodactylos carnosus]
MARSTFISFDNDQSSHNYSPNAKERESFFNDHTTTGVPASNKILHFHHRLMPTISSSSRTTAMPTIISATTQQQPIIGGNRKLLTPQITFSSAAAATTQSKDENNFLFNNILDSEDSLDKFLPTTPVDNKTRLNPKTKRNIRGKRRSTGIHPESIVAQTSDEVFSPGREDDSQPTNDQIIIRQTSNSDYHDVNKLQSQEDNNQRLYLEERINALETLLLDKDSIIYDLQRKLDNLTRDLSEAEQEIYVLHKDKLSLIRALSVLPASPPTTPSKG